MKNITLSVDEKVLAKVRRRAAEKGTTVNALVREHLVRLASEDDRIAKARRELLEMAERSPLDLGPDWKWNREEIYAERDFSRHERPALRGKRQEP